MALRLIDTVVNDLGSVGGVLMAKVYRDAEWNEYRVKFYRDGRHQSNADMHTDDKQDAIDTAKFMCLVKS